MVDIFRVLEFFDYWRNNYGNLMGYDMVYD